MNQKIDCKHVSDETRKWGVVCIDCFLAHFGLTREEYDRYVEALAE